MKYYLVATFDSESYDKVQAIQEKISRKYDLYDELPILHMTLEVIDECDTTKLIETLDSFFDDAKRFWITTNGAVCFEPPFKSVNLLINKDDCVMKLIRNLNSHLQSKGFSVREDIDKWDLHISLANNNFSVRKWSQGEYVSACNLVKSLNFKDQLFIDGIELWKPVNNKDEMVLKSFRLK